MQTAQTTRRSIAAIRDAVKGRVVGPEDADYDHLRTLFLGGYDPRPAAIVLAKSATDVSRAVTLAREADIELAIRSGGHSGAGHSTIDGGVVLDLRELNALEVDADGQTAWAQTGLTTGAVTTALAERGRAVGFGDTASVGIGGITLGGGVGYLVRKHGLTIDSLLAAEIVTADGVIRRVDAENEPDLFWAIRGGGGNFGVATRFRYRLAALEGAVGGMLMLPATPDTVAGFIEASERAPEELSGIGNVMPAPPMPFVPAEQQGKIVIFALMCYAGTGDAAERAYAPFRALAKPIVDIIRPIRYPEMYPPEEESYHPKAVNRTMFVDRVDRAVAKRIIGYLEASDATMRVAQLRVLGGAMARVPSDATAFAHRKSRIMVNLAAFYEGAEDRIVRERWVDEFQTALQQSDKGAYVNFFGEEGQARIRSAYPGATYERLAQVKARYDPTNFFRRNQNIAAA